MTNVRSAAVPAMIHLNNGDTLADWWSNMWFFPWARALVRKSIRFSRDLTAAQSYLLGGEGSWDSRGGGGGVWTDSGQWISFGDLVSGYERDVFNDGQGTWGSEGDPDDPKKEKEPIYNQFGKPVKVLADVKR